MLYSQRNRAKSAQFLFAVPPPMRVLVLRAIEPYAENYAGGFTTLMDQVGQAVLRKIPGFRGSMFAAVRHENPVIDHFLHCDDEQALDLIELCFQQPAYTGRQDGVDAVNTVFIENEIGYQLTRYIVRESKEKSRFGFGRQMETDYPRIIRRDQHVIQEAVIEPAFHLLSNASFAVANAEMLDAYAALRSHKFEDAITSAGSAFESTMKTICDIKHWKFDPDRDTCSRLVAILQDNGLFPPFYGPIFLACGTVRNKLGDAHGRGPSGSIPVTRSHAEHLIHMISAHILLLARLANVD
jgi:hypothetical protein